MQSSRSKKAITNRRLVIVVACSCSRFHGNETKIQSPDAKQIIYLWGIIRILNRFRNDQIILHQICRREDANTKVHVPTHWFLPIEFTIYLFAPQSFALNERLGDTGPCVLQSHLMRLSFTVYFKLLLLLLLFYVSLLFLSFSLVLLSSISIKC